MPELDTLRGVAILLVLFLHGFAYVADPASFTGLRRTFMALTSYGWIGVHLFFVLSGFLITGILLDTQMRPDYYHRFYARRALRILPAYYGLLVILTALHQTSWLGRHAAGIPFLLLSLIYLSNVAPLVGIPIQYTVLWSLAVEEHFYLIWPTIVRKLSRRSLALVALGVFIASPVVRVLSLHFGRLSDSNFYTWCNADGLALGAFLAIALREGQLGRRLLWGLCSFGLLLCGSTLILAAKWNALTWASTSGFALRLSLLNLTFAALLVFTLLLGTSRWSFLVNLRPLQFFGEISYGLYLIHMLVFYGYEEMAQRYWPSLVAADGQFGRILLQFTCAGTLSIVAAAWSRRYFEEYFLRLKDRLPGQAVEHKKEKLGLAQVLDFNATTN